MLDAHEDAGQGPITIAQDERDEALWGFEVGEPDRERSLRPQERTGHDGLDVIEEQDASGDCGTGCR